MDAVEVWWDFDYLEWCVTGPGVVSTYFGLKRDAIEYATMYARDLSVSTISIETKDGQVKTREIQ